MATFKALVYADNKRRDGTYNVKIRVTHRRQSLKVSTTLYVDGRQLTRSLNFRDARIIDLCDDIVRRWRGYVNDLGVRAEVMTAKQLVEHIRERERSGLGWRLDFVTFCREQLPKWKESTRRTYVTAVNQFEKFAGAIDVNEITPDTLRRFESWTLEGAPRGAGRDYLSRLRKLYKMAQMAHNDPYSGVVRIPLCPFDYFTPTIKMAVAEKRALPIEVLQRILHVPDGRWARNVARDVFALSLGTMGANVADIVDWPKSALDGDILRYERKKTRGRRADGAPMEVRIEPEVRPIIDKYRARKGDKLLDFRGRDLNHIMYRQLRNIAQLVGLEHLTFYAARHSWATIARNELGIDKDTVAESLNHSDPARKVTDMYIRRDYTRVWEANKRVVSLFRWPYNKSE